MTMREDREVASWGLNRWTIFAAQYVAPSSKVSCWQRLTLFDHINSYIIFYHHIKKNNDIAILPPVKVHRKWITLQKQMFNVHNKSCQLKSPNNTIVVWFKFTLHLLTVWTSVWINTVFVQSTIFSEYIFAYVFQYTVTPLYCL